MPKPSDYVTHPAFGALTIHRSSGRGTTLFMSPIRHDNTIRLEISTASVARDLSADYFHGGREVIVEVEMSAAQFAEAITSLNLGSGVPVTIRYRQKGELHKMPEPPDAVGKPETFHEELRKASHEANEAVRAVRDTLRSMAEGKTKANITAIKKAAHDLDVAYGWTVANAPFVAEQFEGAQRRIVAAAKAEVEAFAANGLRSIALASIKESLSPDQKAAILESIAAAVAPETPLIDVNATMGDDQ